MRAQVVPGIGKFRGKPGVRTGGTGMARPARFELTTIFSRLLMDRIVFLGAPINDDVANIIIAQLLFLEADNQERETGNG